MSEDVKEKSNELKDLTSSLHDAGEDDPVDDPVYQSTRRNIIRGGNIFFALLGFSIFIPMLVGVGNGISTKQVWDPYTDQAVYLDDGTAQESCAERARKLLLQAGRLDSLEPSWSGPFREWQTRCRGKHPELNEALQKTRDSLRRD